MKLRILFVILFLLFSPNLLYAQSKEEALRLYQQGQEESKYGKYQEAISYYERSLTICRRLDNLQGISSNLNNIGFIYNYLGQYEKALYYHEEALKIRRKLNIPQDIATTLGNIGFVYNALGQYEKALYYDEEALKIRRKLNIPEDIAVSLNNIGGVYRYLGQYEKTLPYYEESLMIFRELNIPLGIATGLNNIGGIYHSMGQYEKALSHYDKSLKIARELNIPQSIASSLSNIGFVYLFQKRYKEAEEKLFEQEKELEKTGKWTNPGLVEAYLATGRNEEALKVLKGIITENIADPHLRILFYTEEGLALKGSGSFKEASFELLKAVSISEELRRKINEKTGFLGAGGRIRAYKALVATLSERAIRGEKQDAEFASYGKDLASNAFYFSESTKARTLLEGMAESARKYEKPEIPTEIKQKEEDILNQLSAIENQWEETYKKSEEGFKELVERKERLKKELESLISILRKEYRRYASLNYPRPIPAEELPLKDNEVLLEYAIGDDASYLFRVRKGGVEKVIKIPAGREEIEKLANDFILPLQNRDIDKFSASSGQKLYSLLLEDGLKDLSPEKNIIIVPDGILGLLPFEALVITPDKDLKKTVFVADKWNISYYQSATVLALNRGLKPSVAKKPIFALGDPIYNQKDERYIAYKQGKPQPVMVAQNADRYAYRALATRSGWGRGISKDSGMEEIVYTRLPETEKEVKAIAKLFGVQPNPPDVLLNVFANETNLRKVPLNQYHYLHFATHADLPGKVQGINEPFLLLGQVENQGKDNGFLTLTKVLELSLDADMVVLSACVTGRGKATEGEGVLNFARAFHYAGARSVVVSLWEVASEETVEYMESFYGHLREGKSRSEALSLARNEIKAKYPNPYYWAPFILHGER